MSAYRADMTRRSVPFGPDDDRWLEAANALHFAATSPVSPRKHQLYQAIGIAIEVLGEDRIAHFVDREWLGERTYVEGLAVLADEIQAVGALHLAASIFDDLLSSALDLSGLERGRVLALRARVEM